MKFLIPVLVLLSSSTFFAQSTYVGLTGNINSTYRNLYTHPTSGVQWIVNLREDYEESIFSYNGGFNFGHRFTNNLIVETGAQYSRYGYKTVDVLLTTAGDGKTSTENKALESRHYVGVPLMVGYSFLLKEKLRLNVLTGADMNVLLARSFNFSAVFSDGSKMHTKGTYTDNPYLSRFVIMSSTNVSFEYDYNSKFMFRMAPTFRYAITPIADAPIKERPYAFGLNLGMYYKLGARE